MIPAHQRLGSGPAVVLLHGWSLTGRLWDAERDLLASEYELVIPDLPGVGRSAAAPGPYTVRQHAAAIRGLLDEIDLTDTTVMGFAYGAAVAMEMAIQSTSRVASTVLVGLPSRGSLPDQRMLDSMRRDWPSYAHRSAIALGRRADEATITWLREMFSSAPQQVAAEMWADISSFDPLPLCPALTAPALLVHGADDEFAPVASARAVAAQCKDAELAVAEDCGHLVMLDQPEWFHATVLRHLRRIHGSL